IGRKGSYPEVERIFFGLLGNLGPNTIRKEAQGIDLNILPISLIAEDNFVVCGKIRDRNTVIGNFLEQGEKIYGIRGQGYGIPDKRNLVGLLVEQIVFGFVL